MKGPVKLGIAVAVVAAAAGVLVVAAEGARGRGRMTHCRNNLRKIGEMAYQKLESEPEHLSAGRAFWQEVRAESFSKRDRRTGKDRWDIRFGGLNPFACPVRGVQPLDLTIFSNDYAGLDRFMSDPGTIDFRGPKAPFGSTEDKTLGGDLVGNHSGGKGHVLLMDLSVREIKEAMSVTVEADAGTEAKLAD